jgi:hypothetical protein
MSNLIPIKLVEMACENLQKEIDALSVRVSELQAENEHLRKAGDNAIKHSGTFNVSNDTEREQYQKWIMVIREWDTAKGVQS